MIHDSIRKRSERKVKHMSGNSGEAFNSNGRKKSLARWPFLGNIDFPARHAVIPIFLICLILLSINAEGNDFDLTVFIHNHNLQSLSDFMGRTLFEGELPGGGDPLIFFLIGVCYLYVVSWLRSMRLRICFKGIASGVIDSFCHLSGTINKRNATRDVICDEPLSQKQSTGLKEHFAHAFPKIIQLEQFEKKLCGWRHYLGYIVISASVTCLFMVHGLKWVVGRARPCEVIFENMYFTEWFQWGPRYVTQGIFRGSFPSGHTAAAFILMSLAYVLAADSGNKPLVRAAGLFTGILAVLYASLMALARSMTLSHWIFDSAFSLLAAWIIMHVLYFWILDIPRQTRYLKWRGSHPELPAFWEIRFCLLLLGMTLGAMLILIGIRSIRFQEIPWLFLLTPIGGCFLLHFGRKVMSMYSGFRNAYHL